MANIASFPICSVMKSASTQRDKGSKGQRRSTIKPLILEFCRVRLRRPLEGEVKQLRITRRADGWYALLVCELAKPEPLPATGQSVGVDVGVSSFATLSNGEKIENPQFVKHAADNLTKQQRRLSKKKTGSANRQKARRKVALAHLRVSRARKHFHHERAAKLVRQFDASAVEELNIKGLVKNPNLFCKAKLKTLAAGLRK